MSEKFIVTGAAGFIASEVCKQLLDAGKQVHGIDEMNDAYDVRLKEYRLGLLQGRSGFTFDKRNIAAGNTVSDLRAIARESTAIIHLAGRAGVRQSVTNPWIYVDANVTGTLNMLEVCRDAGVSKFVLASTSSLYGEHNALPFREDAATDRPLSPYAASKKAAEAMCATYNHLHGIDVTVLRYFTVYGPACRPDMSILRFVQWVSEGRDVTIYGDGSQSRDFTYVEDIARGTIAALRPLGYDTINLGSDRPVPLRDLLALVERLVGQKARIVYKPKHAADVPSTWADVSKAKRLLDWAAQTTYEQGVANLVAWYQRERAWAKDIATD